MIAKYFSINEDGHSIRCKIYANDIQGVRRAVVYGHGFGGHKDNKAAEKFAERTLSKEKDMAVITFNWPCHGDDASSRLLLDDCLEYLHLVLQYAREHFDAQKIYGYATSFGGYLFLLYLAKAGNPFCRLALRCPAVAMYDVMLRLIPEDDLAKLAKGKTVLVGFDRKVKVEQGFLEALKEADIRSCDYLDYAENILILQGAKDEVLSREETEKFAENNVIELETSENADHRFSDPKIMDAAIHRIYLFLFAGK